MIKINYMSSVSYKSCQKKQFSAHFCIPPKGSVIVNETWHPDLSTALSGKSYLSPEDLERLRMYNPMVYNTIRTYLANKVYGVWMTDDINCCVYADTTGDYFVYPLNYISQNFFFEDGNGGTIGINDMTLKQRAREDYLLNWVRIKSLSTERYMACHIPRLQQGKINTIFGTICTNVGGKSGNGDFIICNVVNGKPNLATMQLVKGWRFKNEFNNQGWVDCVWDKDRVVGIDRLFNIKFCDKVLVDELLQKIAEKISDNSFMSKYTCIAGSNKLISKIEEYDDGIVRLEVENDKCKSMYVFSKKNSGIVLTPIKNKPMMRFKYEDASVMRVVNNLLLFLGFYPKGYLTNFNAPVLSNYEIDSIKYFTGNAYKVINTSMRNGNLSKLDMETYLKVINLYRVLNSGYASKITLFRGTMIDKDVNVGAIIPCNSFTSFSLSYHTAESFGTDIFICNLSNQNSVKGIYINPMSNYRDGEYEFLLNAGYNMIVKKHIADLGSCNIWYCTLERNPHFHLDLDRLDSLNLIEKISLRVSKTQALSDYMFIESVEGDEYLWLGFYSGIESISIEVDEELNIYHKGAKIKSFPFEGKLGNDFVGKVCEFLENYVKSLNIDKIGSKTLYRLGVNLMFNLTAQFQNNGYLIINQDFSKHNDVEDSFGGKLTLSGDNDDNITLFCKMDDKAKVKVAARSNNKKFSKEYDYSDTVSSDIYSALIREFRLNQFHRVEKMIDLVAKYKNVSYESMEIDEKSKSFSIKYNSEQLDEEVRDIYVSLEGDSFVLNYNWMTPDGSYSRIFSFYDNLISMASVVAKDLVLI